MSSYSRRLGAYFISFEMCICLVLCTALWGGLAALAGRLGLWGVMSLLPIKVFIVLTLITRLGGLMAELWARRRTALVSLGIIVAIAGVFANYAFRFEGSAKLGEGEVFSGFEWVQAGPMAATPSISFAIVNSGWALGRTADDREVTGLVDGNMLKLGRGASGALPGGYRVRAVRSGAAPLFIVKDSTGKEVFSAYVKLNVSAPGDMDYFQLPEAPHRIYLSIIDDDHPPLEVKVLRGKLLAGRGRIRAGEAVEFESALVHVPEVVGWAEIVVSRYPGNIAIYAGFALVLGGVLFTYWRRD